MRQQMYLSLIAEVAGNCDRLEADHYSCLAGYYQKLKQNVQLRPFYEYNWVRRVEPMERLIADLPNDGRPWRVLDAGCGVGTEAIFWSILRDDIKVTGVDINTERLDTARARLAAYERQLGRSLRVRFAERDVFEVLGVAPFDVVWAMEAISHIDPVEEFLRAAYKSLGSRGWLVISDSHLLNPVMAWRIWKLRRRFGDRVNVTTATGKVVSYARERLFAVGQLTKMLKEVGFRSVESQLSVFFPPSAACVPALFELCKRGDAVLNRVPGLRNLGGIYTVVASKD